MPAIMKHNLDLLIVEAFKGTNTVCARQPRATICYPTHYDLTVQEELEAVLNDYNLDTFDPPSYHNNHTIDAEWDEIAPDWDPSDGCPICDYHNHLVCGCLKKHNT